MKTEEKSKPNLSFHYIRSSLECSKRAVPWDLRLVTNQKIMQTCGQMSFIKKRFAKYKTAKTNDKIGRFGVVITKNQITVTV